MEDGLKVWESENILFINRDFTRSPLIKDAIDFIITDPPYYKKYRHLYKFLLNDAYVWLVDRGNLIFLFGHYLLPDIIEFGKDSGLRFWWLGWMVQTRIQGLQGIGVSVRGKPFMWYIKGKRRSIKEYGFPFDTLSSNLLNDLDSKSIHKWGQDYQWFAHYIKELTHEGEIVFDPMAGSASVGLACLELKRRCLLYEIDSNAFDKAITRLQEIEDGRIITLSAEGLREKICSKIAEWRARDLGTSRF